MHIDTVRNTCIDKLYKYRLVVFTCCDINKSQVPPSRYSRHQFNTRTNRIRKIAIEGIEFGRIFTIYILNLE